MSKNNQNKSQKVEQLCGVDGSNDFFKSAIQFELAYGLIDLCEIGLIVLNEEFRVAFWNKWMEDVSKVKRSSAIGRKLENIFSELNSKRLNQAIEDAIHLGVPAVLSEKFNPHTFPLYASEPDRKKHKLMHQMITVKRHNTTEKYCLIQISNVSSSAIRDSRLKLHASLSIEQALHTRAILSAILDAVITTDRDGCIDYINPEACRLTQLTSEQALGRPLESIFILAGKDGNHLQQQVKQCLAKADVASYQERKCTLFASEKKQIAIEYSLSIIKNKAFVAKGVVIVFRDITDNIALNEEIAWQASHDMLTKLRNRYTFDQELSRLVSDAIKHDNVHVLLYIDLDQFKIINDVCGHLAGDELLQQVAEILNGKVREKDILARLGGDEFGVLLYNCPIKPALKIANKIRQAIQDFRFGWEDKSFTLSASIGAVEINKTSKEARITLGEADAACYSAKDSGRNQIHLYRPDESEAAERHGEMSWVSRIQKALDEDRLILYGQKIVPTTSNEGEEYYEVLVRLVAKNGDIVPPGAFIPAAERYGLIGAIDRWVVNEALKMAQKLNKKGMNSRYKFAINLSGASLTSSETLDFIMAAFEKYKVPYKRISFEITETAAISNLSAANRFIAKIRGLGCSFSLDDFGSGLSSFSYLKNMPVDSLKIDGAFVKDMHNDPIDRAMVESINQVGHAMGLKTVAEFVENDKIIAILKEIGVDFMQGYGISKPQPLDDIFNF